MATTVQVGGQPLRWGCGLKFNIEEKVISKYLSASAMGLWIEIDLHTLHNHWTRKSASAMGLWIEITHTEMAFDATRVSLCDGAVD